MPSEDRFCSLILSHGRPDNVTTLRTLNRLGYTGDWFIVIDDEDPTAPRYIENFGADKVVVFSKQEIADRFDEGDNFTDRRCIFYARNASFDIAEKLGYRYFMQLDDDYGTFSHIYKADLRFKSGEAVCKDLDEVFGAMLDYYKSAPAITTLAMAQGGDLIGGASNAMAKAVKIKRKAMNSFICDTKRRFEFPGRINEDVNAYTSVQRAGKLFFTTTQVKLEQTQTQANPGGMSELYEQQGTYIKSFYSVMHCPSAVKIWSMSGWGKYEPRLHHLVDYERCAPKVIAEQHRKAKVTTKK
jgi:hypothetical protein